jgi:hypothetical protein
MNKTTLHHYRAARAHQMALAVNYGGSLTIGPSGRTERTFGAAYGFHAYAALMSAKRAIHFRATLKADLAAYHKRQKAARKAAKTRKANKLLTAC